jgi:dTMP kinase
VFITLEGIDRTGKTTQAALLADALGPQTLRLREPGGTPVGERVRDLLMDPSLDLGPGAELLLFSAARAQLCREVVGPAREEGRDVVCDRFIDSTSAYQGVARELGLDLVEQLNSIVVGGCVPDLTLLLRLDPVQAERRGQQRLAAGEDDGSDRFESEGLGFQRRVADAYDELAARHPERIFVVDAAGTPEEVHARVMETVSEKVDAIRDA